MNRELIKPLILLVFGATLLLLAVRRLRQYKLKERYTLLFLFTGLPFLLLAAWPNAIGWLALKLDVQYGTVALLCISAFLLLMIFELLTIVSLQDRKITTLAQMVGIIMERHGLNDRPLAPPEDGEQQADGNGHLETDAETEDEALETAAGREPRGPR